MGTAGNEKMNMDVKTAILQRRSIRRFQNREIAPGILLELVDLARHHASGGNLQPLRYGIISQPELKAAVFSQLKWAMYLPGFHIAREEQPAAYIVIINDTGVRASSQFDVGAASTTIMLAAAEYGLGSCCLGAFSKETVASMLELPPEQNPELIIALGYPAQESVEVPLTDSVKYTQDASGNFYVPKRGLSDVLVYSDMAALRYGILSTSSIAPRFIAAVREGRAGEIVALSSRSLEKAQEKAAAWNIPTAYGSHWELLQDPNVNIVYISTVNAQHYFWAKAALENGKHVICEKPCTTTADHTRELFALAREKGLFFMEAEKMLFLPTILEVRRRIEAGELGTIHMAELSHSFSAQYNTWMFDREAGGGPLLSSGIYAVQLIQWLFGSIDRISGVWSTLENGVEWQYVLSGETESGVLFSAKNSTGAILDNTAKLYGSRGWVEIPEYWKARKAIFHLDGKTEVVEFPCAHELIYEAQHIQACLQKGLLTSPVVTEELSVGGIAALERVKAGR